MDINRLIAGYVVNTEMQSEVVRIQWKPPYSVDNPLCFHARADTISNVLLEHPAALHKSHRHLSRSTHANESSGLYENVLNITSSRLYILSLFHACTKPSLKSHTRTIHTSPCPPLHRAPITNSPWIGPFLIHPPLHPQT